MEARHSRPVRVLVIDDSALVRKLMTGLLSSDPRIEVVGSAADPFIARQKIKQLAPDVLTLDVEMPRMNGIEFLEKIMRLRPTPVIMISTLTQAGADTTIEALALGAIDCVGKPGPGVTALEAFAGLPFQAFDFHGFKGNRRIVSYGGRYDFSASRLEAAEPIPDFLLPARAAAVPAE